MRAPAPPGTRMCVACYIPDLLCTVLPCQRAVFVLLRGTPPEDTRGNKETVTASTRAAGSLPAERGADGPRAGPQVL